IAQAFLFCGPRGIGKTSCARILAKSFNCQDGPTLAPCGTCPACREITNGNSFDVIEVDGASNRGIDEVRTLRENVKFAPAYGRYKIYIVDEVHMLTTEAFNALLKTLEEPPAHVKFIFATTEANKVPATILSRCQRFDFKRIAIEVIMANLKEICGKEHLKTEESALFAIAKAAQGSMRDALSILDQLSALGQEGIDSKDVYSMLGIVETELLFGLTDALAANDCLGVLNVFNEIIERGKDIKQLGKDLTEHFRHMMIMKIGGQALGHLVDYPAAVKQRLHQQSENVTMGRILNAIGLFIEAQETSRIMETLRMPLELAFAKLTYGGAPDTAAAGSPAKPAAAMPQPAPRQIVSPVPAAKHVPAFEHKTAQPQGPLQAQGITLERIRQDWNALTHEISRRKMSAATYLQDGAPYACKDGKLTIGFTKDHSFQMECLSAKDNIALIEKVLRERLGAGMIVNVKIIEELPAQQEEPVVKNVLEMFGGEVVKEWHNE
ncbi:MAG: DNA polymerase III subunit gamma/tau, partial [Candidatus Omnitrophica bacterium]|nr:DNA polymerase III subunit gamma/tau [Candidatus Omnitrophota bacterium]